MKVNEAAARLEISPTTCRRLVAAGKLGHYRIGMGRGVIRVAPEHIETYLNQHVHVGQPTPTPIPPAAASSLSPPKLSQRRPVLRHL